MTIVTAKHSNVMLTVSIMNKFCYKTEIDGFVITDIFLISEQSLYKIIVQTCLTSLIFCNLPSSMTFSDIYDNNNKLFYKIYCTSLDNSVCWYFCVLAVMEIIDTFSNAFFLTCKLHMPRLYIFPYFRHGQSSIWWLLVLAFKKVQV